MTAPDNTSSASYIAINAAGLLTAGSAGWITLQEADGQRQLVTSESLPTDTGGTDTDFVALGFTFGEPIPSDPLFRPATLPKGWRKVGSDHSMWSYVVDDLGRRRVAVFYKAAFYDRHALMRLETVQPYARFLWSAGDLPAYDETWCTREGFSAAVTEMRTELVERIERAVSLATERPDDDYWQERAEKVRVELAGLDAWAARVNSAKD